jgi:hypothetical protein
MITLDQALDSAAQLSLVEKEMLIEILKKQAAEERRNEISNEVKEAKALYTSGNISPTNSKHILDELHKSLSEKD